MTNTPLSFTIERCRDYWGMYAWLCKWSGRAEDERETGQARREARKRADGYVEGMRVHLETCKECRRWLASFGREG